MHRHEDEVFHLLSGTVRLRIADQDILLRAGEIAMAPRLIPHSFRVESLVGAFTTGRTDLDWRPSPRLMSIR